MVGNALFVFATCIWLVSSTNNYPPHIWGNFFRPPVVQWVPQHSTETALDAMADLTNNLGVAILQENIFSRGNFAFSPYGVASVLVVLYEGARGESARQIRRAVGFPSDRDIIRIGFRDIHQHLRSYFSHESYLSGISLNKETPLLPEYKRILKLYGYDIDSGPTTDGEDVNTGVIKPNVTSTTSAPSEEKDDGKPDASGSESENTTAIPTENTTTGINTTTVSTTESAVTEASATTVSTAGSTISETNTTVAAIEVPTTTTTTPAPTEVPTSTTTTTTPAPTEVPSTTTTTTAAPTEVPTTSTTTTTTPVPVEVPTSTTTTPAPAEVPTTNSTTTTTSAPAEVPTTSTTTAEPTEAPAITATTTTAPEVSENVTEIMTPTPENATAVTDQSPLESTIPLQNTTQRDTEQTMETTTAAIASTTITEQPTREEVTNNTETLKPESSVTEATNTTTELQTTKMATTTEAMTAQSTEQQIHSSTTVQNYVNSTENSNSSSSTEENTTKQETSTIPLSTGQEEITPATITITEATTTGGTTVKEAETTETEIIGELNLSVDNGMLIPQSEQLVSASGRENNPGPPTPSAYKAVTTSEHIMGITDSSKNKTNSSSEGEQRSAGKNVIKMSGKILNNEERNSLRGIVETKSRSVRTITDYLKSLYTPDVSLQLQNGMYDTYVSRDPNRYGSLPRRLFLVNGVEDIPVPMITYTNIFPYAYIPKLHSRAIEFPLDDARYKLLIILPMERRGLTQLIYELTDYPLRDVLNALKPARVKAMVPTFMVDGFVILTSSLQKLGIWDVFDPRKADLSGMSMDPQLYVRNVEQSVTVVIRNYVDVLGIQTRTMAARYMESEVEVTHPFIYFVLDTSTNVALMAGQVLNPLDSRIY